MKKRLKIMTDSTTTKIEFLRSLGCMEKGHSGRDLYTHLEGTRKKLEELGAPEYLQDAGLFHSVYGTASFKHQSTNDRDKVRALIGEQAEEIVFMFCSLATPRTYHIGRLEESQLKKDLKLLNYANNLEQDEVKNPRLDYYKNV